MATDTEQDELMGLLIAVAREDRQAFQRLYEKISGRMFGLCLKLASQRELAEEAVQDAFVQIWHHAGEYHDERGAPLSWMLTIARYRTLDLMRSRKAKKTAGDSQLEYVEDGREGPLDVSLRSAGVAELTGCLEELSESQRDSILLTYYRGFSHDELSETLSSPIGTVKSWVRRGLIALKRCLER
ncbi:sigma-70 family RNA polymerase sigma factor [Marinobacter salicampi]|uniref:sigma-70 family RNA polymerase sigma factor n=1 Tax=Marinobacter salicampi TaxID=435907 RepID=UPI00140D3BB4|nr:sigma-70 family RNA polymerase sigma factor [Marinobacter salicampi]